MAELWRLGKNVQIACRGRQMLMSHQHLQPGDIHSVLEMMRRERMAKAMNTSTIGQTTSLECVSPNAVGRRRTNRAFGISSRSKDPWLGGALAAVVFAQLFEQPLRQDRVALLLAFAVADKDHGVGSLDVGDLKSTRFV